MSVQTKPTQNEKIIAYMIQFGSISQLEALQDLGVMRLASRISDLRRKGYNIISKTEAVNNRFEEKCYIKRYMIGEADERN
jgi:hypothetical protein